MIFTPLEVRTLETLYPDPERFWEFFYLLSDRLQEESEVWADGARFLCRIRQRPTTRASSPKKWAWWALILHSGDMKARLEDHYANYLPKEFEAIGWQNPESTSYDHLCEALEVFLIHWAELEPPLRHRIGSTWGLPNGTDFTS